MRPADKNKPFESLSLGGLSPERCYPVQGSLIRFYFRLSNSPPCGWPSIFGRNWKAHPPPLKCDAGVDGDAIWIECQLAEVASHHFKNLQNTVSRTNEQYQEMARQHAQNLEAQAQCNAVYQSQLDALNRALGAGVPEPDDNAPQRSWVGGLTSKLRDCFRRPNG